jgi:hypothetical protein
MDVTEAQNRLVSEAQIAAAVVGKGTEFLLLFVDAPLTESVRAEITQRGFTFAGILGYLPDGRCECKSEPDLAPLLTMSCAGLSFAIEVGKRLKAREGDEVLFLERLFALPSEGSN